MLKPGLYAITDNALTPADQLIAAVEAALQGGATLVQYRDKVGTSAERLRQATELNVLCRQAGVPLLINDDPELALRVGAAGVHLGQDDCTLANARRVLGPEAVIGITCQHRLDLARDAKSAGADY